VAEKWVEATGKPIRRRLQDPDSTFRLSQAPKVDLLPPTRDASDLIGQELSRMKAVLWLEDASTIPNRIKDKKYFRMGWQMAKMRGLCLRMMRWTTVAGTIWYG